MIQLDIVVYDGTTPQRRLSGSADKVLENITPTTVVRDMPPATIYPGEAPPPSSLPPITYSDLAARIEP